MADQDACLPPNRWRMAWPWLVILVTILPAIWHVVVFPRDLDPEFPGVDRPTFNTMPPAAYRLADPGDTLDRVAIYLAAAGCSLAAIGLIRSRGRVALWPTAMALSLAALWHASTPGPTFDGWHGLGWRVILDPGTPEWERLAIGLAGLAIVAIVLANLVGHRGELRARARVSKIRGLLATATLLVIARQFDVPGVEPVGYWPRWAFLWGLLAFDLAMVRSLAARGLPSVGRRFGWTAAAAALWTAIVALAVNISWFHRPLDRLREVEAGKLYIAAMPTYQGLKIAHDRHRFKTIINLFPEDTNQRSEILPDEHRFVREHNIRYIEASARDNNSDDFLDLCLSVAQDPGSWPILMHCHGSMDRSPGMMGVYRFLVQGRSLVSILKEIEVHRGYRPKASITLLFNRVLEPRSPERYRADPKAKLLRDSAHGIAVVPFPPRRPPALSRSGEAPNRP